MMQKKRLQSVVPFVSGLGPLMAEQFMKRLSREDEVRLRMDLYNKRVLQKKVFINAIAFLRFNPASSGRDSSRGYNVLDNTRIHPEHYNYVKSMARQALEVETNDSSVVEELMQDPGKIDVLDLDAFAKMLEARRGYMKNILFFIVNEIKHPHADVRGSYDDYAKTEFSTERLFYALSGESPVTLFKNLYTAATIVQKFDKPTGLMFKCKLENGLDAFISKSHIDKMVAEELQAGMVINGKIESVKHDKYQVDISCLKETIEESEVKERIGDQYRQYFVVDLTSDFCSKAQQHAKNTFARGKYIIRKINHPKFKNVTLQGALNNLGDKQIGDFIVRPSSISENHLTITWKFYTNNYVHLNVLEQEKLPGAQIGSKLRIAGVDEAFETLQEIQDRYIHACTKKTMDVIRHPKFAECSSMKDLEELLRNEKAKIPNIIPYRFSILTDYPQFVVLAYMPKAKVIREYFKVKPKGYWFHNSYHSSISGLVTWFK